MKIRVYYEDTDAAGVVYHSNYLNYMERARTEYMRERGCSVSEMAANGSIFPVVRMEIEFKAPARHDEVLIVRTVPVKVGGSTFILLQQILRDSDQQLLVEAQVSLACVSQVLKAKRLPIQLKEILIKDIQP